VTNKSKDKSKPSNNAELIYSYIAEGQASGLKHEDIRANIQDKGVKLSEAQYFVYLDKLNNLNTERLKAMPEEYKNEYIRRINTLKVIEEKLWSIESKGDNKEKLLALNQLQDIQVKIQNFYNAAPIIHGMIQAIRNNDPIKLADTTKHRTTK